jgi:hypothetical protein
MEVIAKSDIYLQDQGILNNNPSLEGLSFHVQILRAAGDFYASLEQIKRVQWGGKEERKDIAFVRLVGGYSEVCVDKANQIEARVQEATKSRRILDTIEALEKREADLRARCGPLDSVEWKEMELKRIQEKIAEEEKRFSSIQAAADLGGAKR